MGKQQKLRSCSAHVTTYTLDESPYKRTEFISGTTGEVFTLAGKHDVLVSYSTPVAIYDNQMDCLYLLPKWDCSVTTQSHVRKFIEDFCSGARTTSAGIRNGKTGCMYTEFVYVM